MKGVRRIGQSSGSVPASMLSMPDLSVHRQWLAAAEADALMAYLGTALDWQQHSVRMFGRVIPSPRLSCWIGDPGTAYAYSGTRHQPQPWPQPLRRLRSELETYCVGTFNSVLCNWYRHGRDSMGWHADDEPELGPQPLIASISLGAGRRFLMRRKADTRERNEWLLQHGDLLLMRGDSQALWQHAVPKQAQDVGARFNLTFRWIRGSAAG